MELQDQETWKIVSKRPMESVYQFTSIKSIWGLPCWLKNKETCQCRRHGFDCWSKRSHIPHAVELLNLSVTITEPCSGAEELQLLSPELQPLKLTCPGALCSAKTEATAVRSHTPQLESSPCSSQTRKKLVQQWRPSSQN